MDHYSAITMNKVQIYAAAWVSLEKRKPDPQKTQIVRSRLYEMSTTGKSKETEGRLLVTRG